MTSWMVVKLMGTFRDVRELKWVEVERWLLEQYTFFLNVEKIRDFLQNLGIDFDRVVFEVIIKEWYEGMGLGLTISLRHRWLLGLVGCPEFVVYIVLSDKLLNKEIRARERLPETMLLIANEIFRHELGHIEYYWRLKEKRCSDQAMRVRTSEQFADYVAKAFLEKLRSGEEEPFIRLQSVN